MHVTSFVKSFSQPRGGLLKASLLTTMDYNDGKELTENWNIQPQIVGTVVDALTRFMLFGKARLAFQASIAGALVVKNKEHADSLISSLKGLDDESITAGCNLVTYDVVVRAGVKYFVPARQLKPSADTMSDIRTMVTRAVTFFRHSSVIESGMFFAGAYYGAIKAGDADYLLPDGIWDMKVIKSNPTKDDTMQLLVYTILGENSIRYADFDFRRIGIFNPRKNKAYYFDLKKLPAGVKETIQAAIYS